MDFDDYESLPTSSVKVHMGAGAVAGIMEHCVMFPVDSVKTRMQSLAVTSSSRYLTVRHGLMKMVGTEGFLQPFKGINVVLLGAGPAHALYYSAYESIKSRLGNSQPYQGFIINAAAGCGATLLHDAVMVPVDVVKQRMQMFNSPYSTCFECVKKMAKTEGFSAFYRSYTTQIVMNIPFHAIHIMVYEKTQQLLNSKRTYDPKTHVVAGALAGGIAAGLTTPLDMAKTVLNIQESTIVKEQRNYIKGLIPALRKVYMMQGVPGFFRGIQARVLYQMPGTAISWSVYELFKHQMSTMSLDDDGFPNVTEELLSHRVSASSGDGEELKSCPPDDSYNTNKTVDRLKHLHMPTSLTASCTPIDKRLLHENVVETNRI